MNTTELFNGVLSPDRIKPNEPMKKHTTFKTGGNAELMLLPSSVDEIKKIIDICKGNALEYVVIGNGSNLLVSDLGIKGVTVKLGAEFADIRTEGCRITAQAGAYLASVANAALRASLTGMEFAGGIPGSVGGGVCMNAGAYGGELKDVITEVTVLSDGKIKKLTNEQAGFKYRDSLIMSEGMLVLEAVFGLKEGNKADIKAAMDDFAARRKDKQPLDKPTAGSTFKRPKGAFAGKLIEDAGLRGFSVGGAQVSEKHCGFVINKGGATTADILALIDIIKDRVYKGSGIMLECEVRFIGEVMV